MNVENRYTLDLPSFMSETTDLNTDASLEYQNMFRELYVIVIDEPKDEMHKAIIESELQDYYPMNIEGYSDLVLPAFKEGIVRMEQTEVIDTTINNMDAKLTTISGIVEGIDAYYCLGNYEGKDTYYQVITWTLGDRKNTHQEAMDRILHSLKEL